MALKFLTNVSNNVHMYSDYVSRHSLHKVGVGGLCIHEERILLIKYNYGINKGIWNLPGGYVDLGETLSSAIEREVLEETGVHTQVVDLIFVRHMNNEKKDRGLISDVYIVFNLEFKGGEPAADNIETLEAEFVPLKEINNYEVSGLSKYIIEYSVDKKSFPRLSYIPDSKIKEQLNILNYELYG
jgi:ADP-ribose pyrophosphatase YjhB (NUDIX family)